MWTDPIVKEIHDQREKALAKFNGDLSAYANALNERFGAKVKGSSEVTKPRIPTTNLTGTL